MVDVFHKEDRVSWIELQKLGKNWGFKNTFFRDCRYINCAISTKTIENESFVTASGADLSPMHTIYSPLRKLTCTPFFSGVSNMTRRGRNALLSFSVKQVGGEAIISSISFKISSLDCQKRESLS